jgi:hypothetical protein
MEEIFILADMAQLRKIRFYLVESKEPITDAIPFELIENGTGTKD